MVIFLDKGEEANENIDYGLWGMHSTDTPLNWPNVGSPSCLWNQRTTPAITSFCDPNLWPFSEFFRITVWRMVWLLPAQGTLVPGQCRSHGNRLSYYDSSSWRLCEVSWDSTAPVCTDGNIQGPQMLKHQRPAGSQHINKFRLGCCSGFWAKAQGFFRSCASRMSIWSAKETSKLFSYKTIKNVNLFSDRLSCSSFEMRAQVSHTYKTTQNNSSHYPNRTN